MSDVIRILQLGNKDWRMQYKMPVYIDFQYMEVFTEIPKVPYDLVFIDRLLSDEEIALLKKATKAYTL